VDGAGGRERPRTTRLGSAINASGPRWSPDGTLLAFSGRRRGAPASDDGGGSIWFVRADRMDDAPGQIRGVEGTPIFSPDNKWIAFTKRIAKPKAPQYANDADRLINERFKGKAYEWLNYRFDQRGYLPDPRDPEATPPEELFIVSREGGEAKQLTRTTVNVSGVAWRPDSGASPSSPTSSSATSTPMRAPISGP
jgi:Tol biopolymer transport system component